MVSRHRGHEAFDRLSAKEFQDLIAHPAWMQVNIEGQGWAQDTANGGDADKFSYQGRVVTGTTANATASLSTKDEFLPFIGVHANRIDWGREIWIAVPYMLDAGSTNGYSMFSLGKDELAQSGALGDLDDAGVGFRFDNKALKGVYHTGSDSMVTVDLGHTTTLNEWGWMLIKVIKGVIEWWHFTDPSQGLIRLGRVTNMTTAESSNARSTVWIEADNGGDSSNNALIVCAFKVWINQFS